MSRVPETSEPQSARPPYRPGDIIMVHEKKYCILSALGNGMVGQCYSVQDLSSRELKAIKYINLAKWNQEVAEGCVREVEMLKKLQGPSVVKMYDHEVTDQSVHVVMELGDTDLRRFFRSLAAEQRKLPLTMILYYWTEMLTAVKHIHDNGVIHADLKPENFLHVKGRIKIIDFGTSSNLNPDMTSVVKNISIGTLSYMSPEALRNLGDDEEDIFKTNRKSDVWSLGCILYKLVYGKSPFQHIRKAKAREKAILNENYEISYSLPACVEYVPPILKKVMMECLQRDPEARPSVDQLLQVQFISLAETSTLTPNRTNTPEGTNIFPEVEDSDESDESEGTEETEETVIDTGAPKAAGAGRRNSIVPLRRSHQPLAEAARAPQAAAAGQADLNLQLRKEDSLPETVGLMLRDRRYIQGLRTGRLILGPVRNDGDAPDPTEIFETIATSEKTFELKSVAHGYKIGLHKEKREVVAGGRYVDPNTTQWTVDTVEDEVGIMNVAGGFPDISDKGEVVCRGKTS